MRTLIDCVNISCVLLLQAFHKTVHWNSLVDQGVCVPEARAERISAAQARDHPRDKNSTSGALSNQSLEETRHCRGNAPADRTGSPELCPVEAETTRRGHGPDTLVGLTRDKPRGLPRLPETGGRTEQPVECETDLGGLFVGASEQRNNQAPRAVYPEPAGRAVGEPPAQSNFSGELASLFDNRNDGTRRDSTGKENFNNGRVTNRKVSVPSKDASQHPSRVAQVPRALREGSDGGALFEVFREQRLGPSGGVTQRRRSELRGPIADVTRGRQSELRGPSDGVTQRRQSELRGPAERPRRRDWRALVNDDLQRCIQGYTYVRKLKNPLYCLQMGSWFVLLSLPLTNEQTRKQTNSGPK